MADEGTQTGAGGGSGTAVAEPSGGASREGSGGVVSSESLVTPEIQSKFDEVFGGKNAAADRESGAGQTKGPRGSQQRSEQRQQRKEFFDGKEEDDAGGEAAGNPDPLQAKEHAGDNVSRSRVSGNQPQPQGQQQPGAEEGDDTPTLNPILRQAAMRAHWEPEVIDQLWAENPELAERTFGNLHRSQNELSAQFARFGQQPQQQQQSQQPPRGQSVNPATAPMQSPEDVMRLMTEVYGGEANFQKLNADWNNAVPALIQPMVQNVIVPMQRMLQDAMTFIGGQERQNVAKEAGMFFEGIKKDFGPMYGLDTKTPSLVQKQTMQSLTLTADQIRVGARAQGVQMSVSEALERAHLMLAANHYQEVERQRLTARIKKRSGNLTQRPTQRRDGSAASTTGESQRTLKSAEAAYAARAAELGLDL